MGRNFTSVCHTCKQELMHLRGKENVHIHTFASDHIGHKVEILDDYANADLPEEYEDMFDHYNPELVEPDEPKTTYGGKSDE